MRRLSSYAWRSVTERRGRSLLTIAGIGLGVGILVAAVATNAGIESSVGRTVAEMVGQADLRVTALGEVGLSDATLAEIAGTPGVAVTAPALEQRTFLQRGPSDAASGFRDPVTVLGIDPLTYERVHGLAIVAGAAPASVDATDVLITEALGTSTGLAPGSELTLLGTASSGPTTLRVAGVVAGDGPLVASDGRTVIVPIETARRFLGPAGPARVDVLLEGGSDVDAVAAALEARLTREPYILSTPADLAASLRASAADFQSMVALIAAVALFVGAFLIFNTLSMTVGERTREVGLLRAAGTTRRQVNGLIVLQAVILGIAGSVVGVGLGYLIALGMAAYVRSIEGIPLDRLEVPPAGLALAVAIGLLVTIAAAIEPAWRAGRISPVEALKANNNAELIRIANTCLF